jgi:hypothetical protein
MGPPCPPIPSGSKLVKEKCRILNQFVKVLGIVHYGPVPTKVVQEHIHKGTVFDF